MTDLIESAADLTTDEARELTDRIRAGWDTIAPFVAIAFQRRAWVALGYASWDDYCLTELDGIRPALPVATRRETVAELADAGLSQRAIGTALGIDHKTAAADLRARGEFSPRESVTGADGKSYPAAAPRPADVPPSVDAETLPPVSGAHVDPGFAAPDVDEVGGETTEAGQTVSPPTMSPEPVLIDAEGARWVWHEGEYFHGPQRRPGCGYSREQLEIELGPMTVGLAEVPPLPAVPTAPVAPPRDADRSALAEAIRKFGSDSPQAHDAELRINLNGRLQAFYSGLVNLDPARVAEVAGDDLLNRLRDAQERFNTFVDDVYAVRRRSNMKAV